MSLRVRLIALMGCMLLLSLVAGGWIAWGHAALSVETELDAALAVGAQNVRNAFDAPPGAPRPALGPLIAAFDGDRHLTAMLLDPNGALSAVSTIASPEHPAPAWFVTHLDIRPRRIDIAPPGGGAMVRLETDPRSEIAEVWTEAQDAMAILGLFCMLTIALIYWGVGRALRPLESLARAFKAIGGGDYRPRVEATGTPELTALAHAFNRMAERLAALEERNQRLTDQLLTLQDEERADLARDLHDEIGPFLFAVNIDAAAIASLAGPAARPIQDRIGAIRDAVGHMQKHVKAILGRLRPAALTEIGLRQATANLAAFWQQRHPALAITLDMPDGDTGFGEALDAAIYRIIQESLSNAIRHGGPGAVEITVAETGEETILVRIADDGTGLPATPGEAGYGLVGMRERVAALGGRLAVTARPAAPGTVVTALLPCPAAAAPTEVAA